MASRAGGSDRGRKVEEEEEEEDEDGAEEEEAAVAYERLVDEGEGGAVTAVDELNSAEAGGVTVLVTMGVHLPFPIPVRLLSLANTSSLTSCPFFTCHHSVPHSTSNRTRSLFSRYTGRPLTVRFPSMTSVLIGCSVPVYVMCVRSVCCSPTAFCMCCVNVKVWCLELRLRCDESVRVGFFSSWLNVLG